MPPPVRTIIVLPDFPWYRLSLRLVPQEIREEVYSGRFFREPLAAIACSAAAGRAAACGGNTIKVLSMIG